MKPHVVTSLLILVLGNVFSALYDVSIKWLPQDADVVTFLLIRQMGCVLMLLPFWFLASKPSTANFKLQLLRANIGVVTSIALVIGLLSLPLATVSSVFFSAPIIIIVLGYFWLKEQVTISQWTITFLGFAGILILLRPSEMSWAGLVVLVAAITFSINQITLRKLPQTESPIVTLMLYNLLSIPALAAIGVCIGFAEISWSLVGLSLLSNCFILAYHFCCILAYRSAKACDIAVAEYSGLLFCIFFGWLLFGEWLDALSWVGASLIVLPTLVAPFMIRYLATRSTKISLS